ncbi:MAG: hypothetical protein COB37_10885 [Kordiimonadales bacterium]|nr:MAG: hypothetical protein COB37_10885 [Kordiimonadales bacterium]
MTATIFAVMPTLVVPDVTAAAEYYRDKLGFSVSGIWGTGYSIVTHGPVSLHFCGALHEGTQIQSNDRVRDGVGERMWDVYLHTRVLQPLYDDFKARGADLLGEPAMALHGLLEFQVRDLNGYVLAFGEEHE